MLNYEFRRVGDLADIVFLGDDLYLYKFHIKK